MGIEKAAMMINKKEETYFEVFGREGQIHGISLIQKIVRYIKRGWTSGYFKVFGLCDWVFGKVFNIFRQKKIR